jgi:hemolysin-activating ACP:hemolysin acyltransferase
MTSSNSEQPKDGVSIRVVTGIDPARALGLSVSYLMTKPAFAALPFGHWSRILTGQINRRHYLIAIEGDRVVGFLGWALTNEENGELWLQGRGELSYKDSLSGDIVLINAWAAESNEITRLIFDRVRDIIHSHRKVYFKRFYPDGRVRPSRLGVNDFVNMHRLRKSKKGTDRLAAA